MAPPSNVCAGCRKGIESKQYLQCCSCRQTYDLLCANIAIRQYNSKTSEYKQKWTCVECKCKIPKADNSNTPIRLGRTDTESENHKKIEQDNFTSNNFIPTDDLPNNSLADNTPSMNVTTRKHPNKFHNQNSQLRDLISPEKSFIDDLRSSIREEMEQALSERLPILISNFVAEQVALVVNTTITKLNDRISDLEKKLERMEARQISEGIQTELSKQPRIDTALAKSLCKTSKSQNTCNETCGTQDNQDINSEDVMQNSGWTEVNRREKQKYKQPTGIMRGTASPGATQLEASERWRYLHLFYVKVGTTENQTRFSGIKVVNWNNEIQRGTAVALQVCRSSVGVYSTHGKQREPGCRGSVLTRDAPPHVPDY
ncbi:unnamed protein product [Spodoptera exigua]|nr:unnamed protein product [Spodoptera exigua]